MAIWACASEHTHRTPPRGHHSEVVVPDRLAARLVAEYTRPGQRIADLTGTGAVAEQAWISSRHYEVFSPTLDAPIATASSDYEVAWADLSVATLAAPTSCTPSAGARRRRTRARVEFAALITRPGGIVAVITPIGHAPTGVVDPAPGVVRAASCAGLMYLQHVIALTVPLCEAGLGATIPVRGRNSFDPDHDPHSVQGQGEVEMGLSTSVSEAAATITSPSHLNISVFRKKGRTTPDQVGGEVRA